MIHRVQHKKEAHLFGHGEIERTEISPSKLAASVVRHILTNPEEAILSPKDLGIHPFPDRFEGGLDGQRKFLLLEIQKDPQVRNAAIAYANPTQVFSKTTSAKHLGQMRKVASAMMYWARGIIEESQAARDFSTLIYHADKKGPLSTPPTTVSSICKGLLRREHDSLLRGCVHHGLTCSNKRLRDASNEALLKAVEKNSELFKEILEVISESPKPENIKALVGVLENVPSLTKILGNFLYEIDVTISEPKAEILGLLQHKEKECRLFRVLMPKGTKILEAAFRGLCNNQHLNEIAMNSRVPSEPTLYGSQRPEVGALYVARYCVERFADPENIAKTLCESYGKLPGVDLYTVAYEAYKEGGFSKSEETILTAIKQRLSNT